MAFKVRFFAMAKRENSTAQPNLTGGSEYDNIVLKGPCSVMAPVLELRMAAGADPVGFNYCYIYPYEKYYWVEDWVNDGFIWTCMLKEDVLATYKTYIGNSTQYILRSSYDKDGDIIDDLYPSKADTRIDKAYGLALGTVSGGWYVLGVQNDDSGPSMGSSKFYACTSQGMDSIMSALFSTTSFTGFVDGESNLTESVYKSLFNPIDYITTCMFIPFQPAIVNTMLTSLPYGYWTLNGIVNTYVLDITSTSSKSGSINIPRHPFVSSRGNYCNASPLSRYSLTFQPFGQITIDPALIYTTDDNKLYYEVIVDPISGVGILELSIKQSGTSKLILSQCAQVGVPISISQMSRDYMGFAVSSLGAAGGAISSLAMGNVPGAFGSAASGIASAVQSMIPQIQTQGASGSFAAYYASQPCLEGVFLEPVASDNDDLGRPLCKKAIVSSYPGYQLIRDPDIAINEANYSEQVEIKRFMASGYFYE